jgi:hypothetical protein
MHYRAVMSEVSFCPDDALGSHALKPERKRNGFVIGCDGDGLFHLANDSKMPNQDYSHSSKKHQRLQHQSSWPNKLTAKISRLLICCRKSFGTPIVKATKQLTDHTMDIHTVSTEPSSRSTASLRSCLKKQNGDKKERFHIQFSEDDHKHSVESLKGHHHLWYNKGDRKQCRDRDLHIVQTDNLAQAYLLVYDTAYLQLNGTNGAVAHNFQQALVSGATLGYRTLGRYSEFGQERFNDRGLVFKSVVSMYKTLAMGDNWDTKLREHYEDLTRASRQWAAFMGQIDAEAASLEYATLLPCTWTPPVANAPMQQHRESLVDETAVAELTLQEQKQPIDLLVQWSAGRAIYLSSAPAVWNELGSGSSQLSAK